MGSLFLWSRLIGRVLRRGVGVTFSSGFFCGAFGFGFLEQFHLQQHSVEFIGHFPLSDANAQENGFIADLNGDRDIGVELRRLKMRRVLAVNDVTRRPDYREAKDDAAKEKEAIKRGALFVQCLDELADSRFNALQRRRGVIGDDSRGALRFGGRGMA